jgi:hypothetical protein
MLAYVKQVVEQRWSRVEMESRHIMELAREVEDNKSDCYIRVGKGRKDGRPDDVKARKDR